MDMHAWFVVLRLPIEIVAACLAVLPALLLLRAWSSLPEEVPVHFNAAGRPDRWGGRWQMWVVPCVALFIYGMFTGASGAWQWLLGRRRELPHGIEPLLLIRMLVNLLMVYVTWGSIRVALKEAEALDWRVLWGLLLLTFVPAALIPFTNLTRFSKFATY